MKFVFKIPPGTRNSDIQKQIYLQNIYVTVSLDMYEMSLEICALSYLLLRSNNAV